VIRVVDPGLDDATIARLRSHQDEVDGASPYPMQVEAAARAYGAQGRSDRAPFREVRSVLRGRCSGLERCMYCEDAPANEVEHIRPKSLHPELTFCWENFLFACGLCNGPKGNRFKLFVPPGASTEHEAARTSGSPVVAPPGGDSLLLDPRVDDPLDFFNLDLRGTFFFVERHAPGTRERRRAEYTLDLLGLNRRTMLVTARRNAYKHLVNALRCYLDDRANDASPEELAAHAETVRYTSHATVWAEMKRQHTKIGKLNELFTAAPEALAWS
jgi:uncharacterized protein (TIGR02646 family)